MKPELKIQTVRGLPGYRGERVRRVYGRYQWNIKYHDWRNDEEIRSARSWAFGPFSRADKCFERINKLIGRHVRAGLGGEHGGWFVVFEELNDVELCKIHEYISRLMCRLPEYLADSRQATRMNRKPKMNFRPYETKSRQKIRGWQRGN